MSLNFLATRFQCIVAVDDARDALRRPHRLRLRRSVRHDACSATPRQSSVHDVWTGPTITALRHDLNAGGSKFCGDCPLKLPLQEGRGAAGAARSTPEPLPSRMYIECTAACNISCTEACCAPETGITRTRQAGMLDFDLFRRVIDEAGPSLGRIDFFNYGEAFLHKRAVEMCEYIKSQFPAHLSVHEHQRAGAHRGAGAAAGALGHRRGDVLDRRRDAGELREVPPARRLRRWRSRNLRAMADEKRRSRPRSAVPELALHPVHLERQRRGDGAGAAARGRDRRRSPVLGADRSSRERVLAPVRPRVTPALDAHPARDLGRQQSRQRDSRRDADARASTCGR